jgi:hypothetical protein
VLSPQSIDTFTSPKRPNSKSYVVKFDTEPEEAIDPIEAPPTTGGLTTRGNNDVSICKTRFGSTGTTVVVVVGATVVVGAVTSGTVVVTVELSQEVEDACVVAAPIPKRSSGTTATIDTRPAEARTHRATTTPRTNRKAAATATPVAPPVTGNEHTSTANMIPPDQSQTQPTSKLSEGSKKI